MKKLLKSFVVGIIIISIFICFILFSMKNLIGKEVFGYEIGGGKKVKEYYQYSGNKEINNRPISLPFGDTENEKNRVSSRKYKCNGYCSCDSQNDQQKTSTSTPIIRGFSIFVASISSLAAVNLAKKRFNKECERNFEEDETCNPSTISAEVFSCDDIPDEEEEEDMTDYFNRIRRIRCKGHCKKNKVLRREDALEESKKFECHRIMMAWVVDMDPEANECVDVSDEDCFELAKKNFIKTNLDPLCRKRSKYKYSFVCSKSGKRNKGLSNLCIADRKEITCENWTIF